MVVLRARGTAIPEEYRLHPTPFLSLLAAEAFFPPLFSLSLVQSKFLVPLPIYGRKIHPLFQIRLSKNPTLGGFYASLGSVERPLWHLFPRGVIAHYHHSEAILTAP